MYDEARGLDEFFARTEEASREVGGDYEIVCVNDGSRDDTLARLLERRRRDPRIKVVNFVAQLHFITLGVLGEYLGRVFHEVRGRPTYIIEPAHGFDDAD